jgi:hypothetical protein
MRQEPARSCRLRMRLLAPRIRGFWPGWPVGAAEKVREPTTNAENEPWTPGGVLTALSVCPTYPREATGMGRLRLFTTSRATSTLSHGLSRNSWNASRGMILCRPVRTTETWSTTRPAPRTPVVYEPGSTWIFGPVPASRSPWR